MFSLSSSFLAFVVCLSAAAVGMWFEGRRQRDAARLTCIIGVLAAIYCLSTGLLLITDWVDPFAAKTAAEMSSAAGSHGGRGGVVILILRYWPYVLSLAGAYFGYAYVRILRQLGQTARRI